MSSSENVEDFFFSFSSLTMLLDISLCCFYFFHEFLSLSIDQKLGGCRKACKPSQTAIDESIIYVDASILRWQFVHCLRS